MLLGKPAPIPSSEITSKSAYLNRRSFLTAAAIAGAAAIARIAFRDLADPTLTVQADVKIDGLQKSPFSTTEKETPYKDVTNYNNFYEFSTDKYEPAGLAKNFKTRPWTVTIDGLVKKKQVLDVDTIIKMAAPEERIYAAGDGRNGSRAANAAASGARFFGRRCRAAAPRGSARPASALTPVEQNAFDEIGRALVGSKEPGDARDLLGRGDARDRSNAEYRGRAMPASPLCCR